LTDYDEAGVINGLAWTEAGGEVLPIEVSYFPGRGSLHLKGNLGKTMQESAEAALAYVKINHQKFGIDYQLFKDNDIFIYVPRGGIPKDGPSAGIALTTAIISALTKKIVPQHIAMTGGLTSKGKIYAIGGLREKLTAAYEHKLKTIFIPQGNKNQLSDLPPQVKDKLEIITVDNYLQIWDEIKGNSREQLLAS
ncbi:MAG: ATP-dependent protease La, partial [Mycoplasmataceae bacterium RV_VA103A]